MNIGKMVSDFLGFDPTPGFNISRNIGQGVPFVEKSPTKKAPAAKASSGGGGSTPTTYYGGGGGGGSSAASKAAVRSGLSTTQSGYEGGARTQLRDVGNTYNDKTNSFVTGIEEGQGNINRGFATNQLSLRRSMANIVRGIQQGLRSSGVALAGMNAADSGASDAASRAYAKVGNEQSGEARGQAATQEEELQRQQGSLNTKRNEGISSLDTFRDTETGRVRSDFGNKLAVLKSQADASGEGDAVNQGLVEQVLGEALGRLSQIDQSRNSRLSGIKQWTPDEIMKEAIRMDELGQAADTFQVEDPSVNYGSQGQPTSGAPLAQLPIFVKPKDDQTVTA